MSTLRHARPTAERHRVARLVPWVFGAGAVLCQIGFPLTGGGTLFLTLASVVLFALASLSHALVHRGPATAVALLVVAGGGGLAAEAIGLRTGLPFGRYTYTGTLGWEVLDVPAVVPAAWTMMAYPALLVARRLVAPLFVPGRLAVAVVAAWALASWDVFLDPQMVQAGHWRWTDPTPSLPGVEGIPLSNFGGWLLVALVLGAVLDRVVAQRDVDGHPVDDRLPFALYLWTYASSVMAHAVFFGLPTVALVGAVVMGVVAVPLAVALRRHGARR